MSRASLERRVARLEKVLEERRQYEQDLKRLFAGKSDQEIADEINECIEWRDWHGADLAGDELDRRNRARGDAA